MSKEQDDIKAPTEGLAAEQAPQPEVKARTRVMIDFSEEAYERLNEVEELESQVLKVPPEEKSHAHVIRNALRVYEWALQQQQAGVAIRATGSDGTTVILNFPLD
jgi:hypothetical protein